jgi:hypothetical protein
MDSIKLQNGLVALGGLRGEGKTLFCLKLANHLAEKERVLFINFEDYTEKFSDTLLRIDGKINPNLEINTYFEYFGVETLVAMMRVLESNRFTTVFMDQSDFLNKYHPFDAPYIDVDCFIEALAFLSSHFKVRVVFTINIARKDDSSREFPMLRDFNASRHIHNKCSQVLAIYRPHYHALFEDENGLTTTNILEVYSLKNERNTTTVNTLNWAEFVKS